MSTPFYITTPIYYVNAKPHLGHAYTTIAADVAARFQSMLGKDTFFLTGTDEHGDKIVAAAEASGKSPKEYVDEISGMFQSLWPELSIANDQFIRTTDPDHIRTVTDILQKLHDTGDIYFSEYEGLYCFGCEQFLVERDLVDGNCPDHGTPPTPIRESNYFFRMSKYQDWLIDHITSNPDFIRPERYKNEVLAFLREPLEDLCISRPKSRLKWGIPLPFDTEYVTYVWFDALVNYISALGYPDGEKFRKYWPHAQHIVAKDIIKPHGIYWPTMLKAAGIEIYKHLNVHGYWNVAETKMSKSLGNVVDPLGMKNTYGTEAFRFFLMRDMVFGLDSGFSEDAMITRINADLANDLGNLFSRVLTMTRKYFDGTVPDCTLCGKEEAEFGLEPHAEKAVSDYVTAMDRFQFHKGMQAAWELINRMNKYIDAAAPWELAKNKASHDELQTVIYSLMEGLRIVSGLIYPVMPETAKIMQDHLGLDADAPFYRIDNLKWGVLKPGTVAKKSIRMFPRIEVQKEEPAAEEKKALDPPLKPEITFEDFLKVDLRVATVLAAEPVPKAKKLLKLTVDMGETRTIVAGIAQNYTPEDIIGKQVVIVANLKPAKLMGVVSQGMMLASITDHGASLMTPTHPMPPGSPVK